MRIYARTLLSALVCALPWAVQGQAADTRPCSLEAPSFVTNAPNIFDSQQEQDLGDALAEMFEADMRIAELGPDDQLTRIGERLLAQLPPTGIKYRFRIYDSGEINAFSIAGGRVYVSRKLITAVKNEDELAGVVAHELGHLAMHQTAIRFTYELRIRLSVTQVGDRADVFAKVHKFFNTPQNPNEVEVKEAKGELVADRVSMYALVRAGYAPASFPAFLNDVMGNKGKTGNWLSDSFGLTSEDSKRYREAMKLVDEMPENCVAKQPVSNSAFLTWQRGIIEERVKNATESATGDKPAKLDPPMRPSPWRIRFSPDGKYVLVQDEGSITVVDADARKVRFRVEAPDVNAAMFTPDSTTLVFDDDNLRVERWNVASGQRTDTREMVVFDGCTQNRLTPDGKTLLCLKADYNEASAHIGLRLIDVDTSKAYLERPKFFELSSLSSYGEFLSLFTDILGGNDVANVQIDAEGHYMVVGIQNSLSAFDLEKRQQIQLGGKLKGVGETRMSFLSPDKIYVVEEPLGAKVPYKTEVLSFPDGRVLNEGQIGDQSVHAATKGDLMLAGPFKDFATGIFDPTTTKFLATLKLPTADMWNKYLANETATGGLYLSHLGTSDGVQMDLPLGPLPKPTAAEFSPNGKYLAVSLRSRCGIWDLTTGKQLFLIRPASSLWVNEKNQLYAILPKYLANDPTEVTFDLEGHGAKELGKPDSKDHQHENLKFQFKPMGRNKDLTSHSTIEVMDMETQKVLWSHDYPGESPVIWPTDDSRMMMAWDLSVDTAKSEVKKYPKLQEETKGFTARKKGLLIETVDELTGAPLEQVALPEIDLTRGWNDERYARLTGEYLLVNGEHGNTAIYKIDSGTKVGEFFGSPIAPDAPKGLIAAVNREDEILLVDEKTGKEVQRFSLGSPVRLARIISGSDPRLLVLTADQVVHQLPLPQ